MKTKLVIVGGVAGGATAAARARRLNENAEITLFERGEFISFANCGLPYYIGQVIKERDDLLVTTAEAFSDRYQIDIRPFSEVTGINRDNKQVSVQNHQTNKTYNVSYDKLILSPGAEPFKPPVSGIDLDNIFTLRNIPDTDRIKAFIDKNHPQTAVVVGGGFIGLEMAENLVYRNINVTVIEMLNQVMAPIDIEMARLVQNCLEEKKITCDMENSVTSFSKKGDQIQVYTKNGNNIVCDMVIMSAGIRPENRLAKDAGLKIGQRGGIIVDSTMRTSDPHIYAVGDAVEVKDYVTGIPVMMPLAGPANKQGRIAADNALGRKSLFRGTLGTSILKLFEKTIATTGASEKFLKRNQIPCLTSYTQSSSHAGYYPGATPMFIKLVFSPGNGKILGAQIIGQDGVDKRIDVLATAIHGGMTVFDLEELELAYAPPYSSAKDPVNVAGFVATNILKGDMDIFNWTDADKIDGKKDIILDLRNTDEITANGKITKAIHIPLNNLREKLGDLDKNKNYILVCAIGLRGYIGFRIMYQHGFKVKNVFGGFETIRLMSNLK